MCKSEAYRTIAAADLDYFIPAWIPMILGTEMIVEIALGEVLHGPSGFYFHRELK